MAYGIKYRHSYCNEYGVNSTVTILENGYSGSIKDIDAQEDPIVISQEGSDTNKFDTIRPSTASIGLIGSDDFKLEELFTADERKYMVENHVGGVMVWRGFVIPNGFSHEWTGGTFPMEIIASDNLSTLKDFPFLNDNGTVIKGRLNHIDILLKCLNKLDIGIDLLTLTNIVRQGGVAGEDPLFINTTDAYTFLNTDVKEEGVDFYYDNPQNAFNCEDVVNSICRLYGAKLYQSKGQWRFKRVNVDYGASISGQTFHRYNTLGVKVGTVPYNEVIVIPCTDYSGEKAQYSGARLAMSEVYKSAHSRYSFRYLTVGDKLPPIIKNQLLSYSQPIAPPESFTPIDWTVALPRFVVPPAVRTVNIVPELNPGGDFPPNATGGALRIYGGNRRGLDSLKSTSSQSGFNIKKGDRLSLKFWHKTPLLYGAGNPLTFYIAVRVVLQTKNPSKVFNLTNSSVTIPLGTSNIPRFNTPSWVDTSNTNKPSDPSNRNETLAMTFAGKRISTTESVYGWVQEYLLSSSAPEDGTIYIEFAGVGYTFDENRPTSGDTGRSFQATVPSSIDQGVDDYSINYSQKKFALYNNEFKIGQIETGVLPGGSSHPSGIKYSSEQSAKYTQRGGQIPLLTSDVEEKNAISGMLTLGNFFDKWNDSRNPYNTFKPLGLLLTRDIMRQYKNVWRVIEEDIKANGLSFDTTIEFEERPGERYVIQRGAISQKFNRLIGCTLIQVSANPDTAFVGSETIEEDFSSSGGSSGGSGGGGSGGGGGSAPQDLQSVTDIGAETTNIITAKGVRAETLLEIPDIAPVLEDRVAGKTYLYANGDGSGSSPAPTLGNLEDLQNVTDIIANGKYLQKINGVWQGVDLSFPSLAGYALESWVTTNFEPKFTKNTAFNKNFGTTGGTVAQGNDSRINNGQTAYGWGDHKAYNVGNYLGGNFNGDVTNTPSALGSGKLRLQMINGSILGVSDSWNDVLWLSSYSGGDVKGSTAIISSKYNDNIGFIKNNFDDSSWGNYRNLWHSGNLRSNADNDARYSQLDHTHTFASLTSKPTTISGYGITDAYTKAETDGKYVTLTTKQIITGAKNFTKGLGIPDIAPIAGDRVAGVTYLYANGDGSGSSPTPTLSNLEDLQNVQSTIANGKYLQKIAGIWTGVDISFPSLSGYALESWVTTNFAGVNHTHAVVTTTVNGFMSATDKAKLNGISTGANNYVHPSKAWVDKTALTGATVISNLTIDSLGHPTNWVTRTLTPANIGAAPTVHTHTIAQVTGLQSALDGKESSFTKNTAFNKNFGTTAGTVAQGNDSRINNGQTAFGWGNHANKYLPFGINTTNISKNITVDLNTITDSIFYTNASSTNKPFDINSTVLSISGSTGYGGQIAFPYNNARGAVYRKNEGGIWTAWRELWDSSNLRSNTANDSRYVLKAGDTMTGKLTATAIEALSSNALGHVPLASPFDSGLSVRGSVGTAAYGMQILADSSGSTLFQSKAIDSRKIAWDLLFQNRGGGFGIGVDTIPANMKFQIGYTAGAVLVGSVTLTKNSSNITGLYTRFLNYFKKGQRIQIKGVWYYVASVNSATSITISTNATTLAPHIYLGETENNLDYFRDPINTFSVSTNGDVIIGDKLTVPLAKVTRTLGIPAGVPPIGDREAGITYLYALT